jgi:hypothetical protein
MCFTSPPQTNASQMVAPCRRRSQSEPAPNRTARPYWDRGIWRPVDNQRSRHYCPCMKPEIKEQILPLGLLVAALVTGGISWALDGTAFWVMVGITLVLIVGGIVLAGRTESARHK